VNHNDRGSGRASGRHHRFRLLSLVLAILLAASALAACGDDDDDSGASSGDDTTATTAATDDTSGGAATTAATEETGGGEASGGGGDDLLAAIGFDAADEACGGQSIPVGSVLALTGPGSFYGTTMSRGIDLAVDQIAAAGGPQFEVKYYDHKSGDAAAGQQAITELGEGGYQAKLASYVDDLGAMLAGTAQYEMFTFDGGGGTSIFGQAQPFFWGTRAITPNDPLPGLFQYLQETQPDLKTVGLVGWDIGEPSNGIIKEDVLKKIADAGYEFNDLYELTPVGSQDYSQVLPKIKANEPDILLMGLYGQDIGSFINQADTAGLTAQLIGFEFTPDGVNASKGTFDSAGYTFAYDFFDPKNPTNPLGDLFVRTFNEAYGEDPDFYAANFYEDTLGLWDLVRRVCGEGQEVTGPNLDAAFRADPTLKSVYGGDESTAGSKTLDLETHTVTQRTMGVFHYEGGEVTPLAYFDLNGENFQMAG
jgi:branched-chain amino acid transport system substrate-binding protein